MAQKARGRRLFISIPYFLFELDSPAPVPCGPLTIGFLDERPCVANTEERFENTFRRARDLSSRVLGPAMWRNLDLVTSRERHLGRYASDVDHGWMSWK